MANRNAFVPRQAAGLTDYEALLLLIDRSLERAIDNYSPGDMSLESTQCFANRDEPPQLLSKSNESLPHVCREWSQLACTSRTSSTSITVRMKRYLVYTVLNIAFSS